MLSNWKLLSDKLEDWHGLTGLVWLRCLYSLTDHLYFRRSHQQPVNIKQLFITLHCFILPRPTTTIKPFIVIYNLLKKVQRTICLCDFLKTLLFVSSPKSIAAIKLWIFNMISQCQYYDWICYFLFSLIFSGEESSELWMWDFVSYTEDVSNYRRF